MVGDIVFAVALIGGGWLVPGSGGVDIMRGIVKGQHLSKADCSWFESLKPGAWRVDDSHSTEEHPAVLTLLR